ncbi:MAG: BamA/TamA family outer membrane protein [Candidatus Eisenbacteria bacterium]|nr:BamA/TamA family outer membrane protein [Candidatus Eisenbacteria bacterium]
MRLRPLSRACAATVLVLAALAPEAAGARGDLESQLKSVVGIRLRGNHRVSGREIRRVLKTRRPSIWPWATRAPLRLDFLRADAAAIAIVYHQQGFLDVEVSDTVLATRDPHAVVVRFTIREGERSRVATVDFAGARAVPPEVLRRTLYARPGKPFNPAYLIADTALISRQYQERGYLPHVVGSASRDARDSLAVRVLYAVDEGPLYRLGQVYFSTPGALHVREKLVRRELLLKPGSVYRLSRAEESQERLYETGLFGQVQLTPLPDSTNTLMEFFLQVRERKPRWLDAGVGSGTEERFRVSGEWGHRNLIGQGLQGAVGGRLSYDAKGRFLLSRGETSLREPWLFGTRNRAQASLYLERHDYRTENLLIRKDARGVSFQVRRDFGRLTNLRLTQDNTFVTQRPEFLVDTLSDSVRTALLQDFTPSYSTHRLQLGGDRDRRDNPLDPARGSFQTAAAEVAGGPFKGSTSFTKFQMRSSWYTALPRSRVVLATHARGGLIKPFGERKDFIPAAGVDREVARVPTEDVFRLGGVNSVRGYDENEIARSGGLFLLQANAELRVPLAGPFGAEAYVDAGNVWARPEYIRRQHFTPRFGRKRLDPGDVRYVYGAGGRFRLPFGPLRLDYTWGLAGRHRFGRLQFAIGATF